MEAKCPVANPEIVFREEFDDWSILFDPDTGESYGLDPVSSSIWKKLDGKHTEENILAELQKDCEDGIPEDASTHVKEFIGDLEKHGLVGYEEK